MSDHRHHDDDDIESGHHPVYVPPPCPKEHVPHLPRRLSWLSFTAHRDRCLHRSFVSAGLRPTSTDLPDGTTVRCWVPAPRTPPSPPPPHPRLRRQRHVAVGPLRPPPPLLRLQPLRPRPPLLRRQPHPPPRPLRDLPGRERHGGDGGDRGAAVRRPRRGQLRGLRRLQDRRDVPRRGGAGGAPVRGGVPGGEGPGLRDVHPVRRRRGGQGAAAADAGEAEGARHGHTPPPAPVHAHLLRQGLYQCDVLRLCCRENGLDLCLNQGQKAFRSSKDYSANLDNLGRI
ncbi:catalytic/ hydrolase [Iris pallida]|uniref:Catalytic/ hydrolase n=1 Tax=Iris pallida TaxID=29817 RepID=A0AAX6FFV7_IRIPA|nr:catalytic/ hydrolase [Iris pallida]